MIFNWDNNFVHIQWNLIASSTWRSLYGLNWTQYTWISAHYWFRHCWDLTSTKQLRWNIKYLEPVQINDLLESSGVLNSQLESLEVTRKTSSHCGQTGLRKPFCLMPSIRACAGLWRKVEVFIWWEGPFPFTRHSHPTMNLRRINEN